MVLLFYGMSSSSSTRDEFASADEVDLEAESAGERESSGTPLTSSPATSVEGSVRAPSPVMEAVADIIDSSSRPEIISVSSSRSPAPTRARSADREVIAISSSHSPVSETVRRRGSSVILRRREADATRRGVSTSRGAARIAARRSAASTTARAAAEELEAAIPRARPAGEARATAAELRAAAARGRGAPSNSRAIERAERDAAAAKEALRLETEARRSERVDLEESVADRIDDAPVDEPEDVHVPISESAGMVSVQDFFTYCKNWLDHEHTKKTKHVKILPRSYSVSAMCLDGGDNDIIRAKKLTDMIRIGVLFVQHCGVVIPTVSDDNTAISENLRADLQKYTPTSLEDRFDAQKKYSKHLTLQQCVWMLSQFPTTPLLVEKAMSRGEVRLLSQYRRDITYEQCERLKFDLLEYGRRGGVVTSDVMIDGGHPFQENVLAILHRSADAHNRAALDSVKFTVADAVWLSLHTNDKDNSKDDATFIRIMDAVRVHCKHQFDVEKTKARKTRYQEQIKDCKTPGQLLRGNTSALEMSPENYPYHRRPLFPQYATVDVDPLLSNAKETSAIQDLTKPTPRPYEAVLELLYEANCNLNKKGEFHETSGRADVLFPTRRPWKLHASRGLAIRMAHANALKDKFPVNWYTHRDKVPLRVWMQIPLCVSSVFYFKHVHSLMRRVTISVENSPAPMSEEPDFGFPGLPVTLDATHGGFANPSNACYLNASFQALLRSNIGPRFMRSVQRMSRAHLDNLRTYWHTQSTAVKREMKEATRRLLKGDLKFRHGAMPKLCTYHMLILYVIDAHSKNVMQCLDIGNLQNMISHDATPPSVFEIRALEKKSDAMIGSNYLRTVPDDHNCFFSAIALSLHPDYNAEQLKVRQAGLRRELIEYIRTNLQEGTLNETLRALTDEDWLTKMARNLEWGDETAMWGMSYMLGRRITTYGPRNGGHLTVISTYNPEFPQDETEIHIFHNHVHFDVLVPPITINGKMDMNPENPETVASYTHLNAELTQTKMLHKKVHDIWNHFIFFAAMYELTEAYCDAQTQTTISLTHLYDLLLVHRLKINADLGRYLFDYRSSNDAGEAVSELCARSETFALSIKDTHETLKTLISNQEIQGGVCAICSTSESVRNHSNPIARILVEMPTVLDNTPRNLQDFTREGEGPSEGTYECLVCEGAGTAATIEIMTDGRLAKYYGGTRTLSRRHADFTCFQLNWVSTLQENGQEQPVHNPNLVNLTIPETLQLVGVDSAEHAYNLIAAVHHVGGAHYKACVKADGVWMDYNDATAVACTMADAVRCTGMQSDPYLLFYERSTRAGAETPPTPPRAETPPARPQPDAVYVKLPWEGSDAEFNEFLRNRLPSWPMGASAELENSQMMAFFRANRNIAVEYATLGGQRQIFIDAMKRIVIEARFAKLKFGMKRIARLTAHREDALGVVLTQQEILTLMSCALYDFFSYTDEKSHEHIGLTQILRHMSTITETWGLEKTRCILNYLQSALADMEGTRQVRFRRHRASFTDAHWTASRMPMQAYHWHDMDAASGDVVKIEDVCDKLEGQAWEVDFANSNIGGGVLGSGCVQEEIRFMQCPELIVSILFTDELMPDESVQITGYRQFNETRGYGREDRPERFRYLQPKPNPEPAHGRSMLVMDALRWTPENYHYQFEWTNIKRELDKARCAFDYTENATWPIVTGHWGCGAFNGYHRLKAFIQLLAAADAGKRVEFCNFNDRRAVQTKAFLDSIPTGGSVGVLYNRLQTLVDAHKNDIRWFRHEANLDVLFRDLVRVA